MSTDKEWLDEWAADMEEQRRQAEEAAKRRAEAAVDLSRLFGEGNPSVEALEAMREKKAAEALLGVDKREKTVETRVDQAIRGIADRLKRRPGIALVEGGSGIGKTTTLRALGGAYVLVATSKIRMRPLLAAICEAIGGARGGRFGSGTVGEMYADLVDRMKGGPRRLLILDEIHKLRQSRDCIDCLRELFDETQMPQLWCSTGCQFTRYMARLETHKGDPMVQLRRRMVIQVNLDGLRDSAGRLFDVGQVRKILESGPLKADAGAVRCLADVANGLQDGALGMMLECYQDACDLADCAKADVVTEQHVRRAVSARGRALLGLLKAAPEAPAPAETMELRKAVG